MKINKISLLGAAVLSFMLPLTVAHAEYYAGVDGVYMDGRIIFGNGRTTFQMPTTRIRFGQRLEEMGWEIQALAPARDTGTFTGFVGAENEYKLNYGVGILWTAASRDRRWHGGIGFAQLSTNVDFLVSNVSVYNGFDNTQYFVLNFGGQFPLSKNGAVTLDYGYYQGRVKCPICSTFGTPPPGSIISSPEVQIHSLSLGFNYSF